MFQSAIFRQAKRALATRVAAALRHEISIREQLRCFHAGGNALVGSNQNIDVAAFEQGRRLVRGRAAERDTDSGARGALNAIDQVEPHHDDGIVVGGNGEGAVRGQRFKRGGSLYQRLEVPQHGIQRVLQCQRSCRRNHAPAGLRWNQQWVAEDMTKPRQLRRKRWLADVQPGRGAGDIGFFDQRIERNQEIEIDSAEITHGYGSYTFYRF